MVMRKRKKKKKKKKKRKVGEGFRYGGGGLGRLPDSAACSAVSITRIAMLGSLTKPQYGLGASSLK